MFKKKRFYIIAIFVFLGSLTLNLGHPVTPKYIKELGISSEWFGYFFAFMSLGHVIMSPIYGNLSDKYGRKPIFIIGLCGYAFAQFLFITFDSVPLLLIPRITAGVFGSAILISAAGFFSDLSSKSERTKALSICAGLLAFGASAGYLVGGRLGVDSVLGVKGTFKFQIIFALILAVLMLIFVRKAQERTSKNRKSFIQNLNDIRKLKDRNIYIMLCVGILVSISFVSVSKFLDVYISDSGYDTDVLGTFVFITGVIGIISTLTILPFLSGKFKDLNLLKFALILGGAMIFLTFIQNNMFVALYTTFLIFMLFKPFYQPLDQSILSRRFDGNQGTILGIRSSFFAIGNVIGPLIAGFIYKYYGVNLFFFSSGLLILSGLILVVFVRSKQ